MQQIELSEAQVHLAELIETVLQGQEVIISKNTHPMVKIISLASAQIRPQFGSAKGLIRMSKDFDEPLADFAEYAP